MPRWASLHLCLPPRTPGCTASRHVCLGESQSDTLAGELERGHEVGVSRGKLLAAVVVLSCLGACFSPVLAGTQGASRQAFLVCLEWPSRQAPLAGVLSLPGKLLLPGPGLAFPASSSCRGLVSSRQDPLAGALFGLPGKLLLPGPWFEYFVLEWSSRKPRRVLAVTRQALPRDAATARAQVRDTKVPLL